MLSLESRFIGPREHALAIPVAVALAGALAYALHDRAIPVLDIVKDSVLDPMPDTVDCSRHVVFEGGAQRIELLVRTGGQLEIRCTPETHVEIEVLQDRQP